MFYKLVIIPLPFVIRQIRQTCLKTIEEVHYNTLKIHYIFSQYQQKLLFSMSFSLGLRAPHPNRSTMFPSLSTVTVQNRSTIINAKKSNVKNNSNIKILKQSIAVFSTHVQYSPLNQSS